MEVLQINCTGCNNSCPVEVTIENNEIINVEGCNCHRGPISVQKKVEKLRLKLTQTCTSKS